MTCVLPQTVVTNLLKPLLKKSGDGELFALPGDPYSWYVYVVTCLYDDDGAFRS